MEQPTQPTAEEVILSDDYDAAPRDGPAIFIADAAALDHEDDIRGVWLDPTQPTEAVLATLHQAGLPAGDLKRYVVIDQRGLGPVMVDEDPDQIGVAHLSDHPRHQRESPSCGVGADETIEPTPLAAFVEASGEYWASVEDLARDYLANLPIDGYLEGLPDPPAAYIAVDLNKLGADLAAQLGAYIDEDDGGVLIPEPRP